MSDQQFPEFTQPGQKPKINSIFDFSAEALGQLRLWLEQNPPAIGISNILGFSQYPPQYSEVLAQEATSSTSFTNLTTVGPSVTGLPAGKFVVIHGGTASVSVAGTEGAMGLKINSTEATFDNSCYFATTSRHSSVRANLLSLTGDNNTLTCRYRTSANTTTFDRRWLVAFRAGNA